MIKKSIYAILLILLTPFTVNAANVIADGYGGDERSAVQDAYRAAVSKVVSQHMDANTLIAKAPVLYNAVYSHAEQYVHGYKLLTRQGSNGVLTVTAQVDVDASPTGKLMQVVKEANSNAEPKVPQVGIIVIEKNRNMLPNTYVTTTLIADKLQEAGFSSVKDAKEVLRTARGNIASAIEKDDVEKIVENVDKEEIDYLIVGQVAPIKMDNAANKFFAGINLKTKIVKLIDGEVVAANKFETVSQARSEKAAILKGLETVSKEAGGTLGKIITGNAVKPAASIHLILKSGQDPEKTNILINHLKKIRGVREACVRTTTDNLQIIDVFYSSGAPKLVSLITKELKSGFNAEDIKYDVIVGKVR